LTKRGESDLTVAEAPVIMCPRSFVTAERAAMIAASRSPGESNLPIARTTLVGRERELAAVRTLLLRPDVPLLALFGPGGIGKTRLALQVAADLREHFADGVCFVPLAPIHAPALVAGAIATALAIPDGGGGGADRLGAYLRSREILLVLDNCEHLVAGAPVVSLLSGLLASCPSLRVLATSRERFQLSDEHNFPVPVLAAPDLDALPPVADLARIDAVALFVQRAAAVDPAFALTTENAADIAEICVRLDGLPLAIELAAARIRHLTPAALRARLANRLLLLADGPRDQPPRLRSMRDAIAWSYDLLTAEEQALFRRLAVFVGGFTLEEAEWIAGLDVVSSLVDKSLISATGHGGQDVRLRLLETMREYALERLFAAGEADAARSAHAHAFLNFAESCEARLRGPQQTLWCDRLESEHPNLRAALTWFLTSGELVPALRLAGALGRFWEARGHRTEGRRWFADLLTAADRESAAIVPPLVRAKAELWAGVLAYWQDDYQEVDAILARALPRFDAAGDDWGAALALLTLGQSATYQGKLPEGCALIRASLDRFRAIDDAWGIAVAQSVLVNPLLEAGDLASVEQLLAENIPLVRTVGDPNLLTLNLINLGWLASWRGDDIAAEQALTESLDLFRECGDRRSAPYTLNLLALVAWRRGERGRASSLLVEGLTLSRDLGTKLGVLNSFVALSTVAVTDAKFDSAARLLGAADAIRAAIGSPIQPVERPEIEAKSAAVRAALGDEAYAAAWKAGRALSSDDAIAEGLALAAEAATPAPPSESPDRDASAASGDACGLTARELEVLRLIVEGHSNPRIAAALFISHKTVRNHVTSILTKLGVETRTAAASSALRRGLV
jgi:predicted ATPase/DNA-binding CsgD family transcriptional regulator